MWLSAPSELRGGRRSIRCGSSCGPNQACAPTGTTCFSITTPRAATWRWTWTSALRSHARLNPKRCVQIAANILFFPLGAVAGDVRLPPGVQSAFGRAHRHQIVEAVAAVNSHIIGHWSQTVRGIEISVTELSRPNQYESVISGRCSTPDPENLSQLDENGARRTAVPCHPATRSLAAAGAA